MNLQKIAQFGVDADAQQMVYSPDGKWLLVIGYNGPAYLTDTATYRKPTELKSDEPVPGYGFRGAAFTADGRLFVLGNRRNIDVWQVAPLRRVHQFEAHSDQIDGLQISPDGRWLVSGSMGDRATHIWSVPDWKKVATLMDAGGRDSRTAAFSQDGNRLYLAGKRHRQPWCLRGWEWKAGRWQEFHLLGGLGTESIIRVSISPTEKYLVTVSDTTYHDPTARHVGGLDTICVWQDGRLVHMVKAPGMTEFFSISYDDCFLAAGIGVVYPDQSSQVIWELKSGRKIAEYPCKGISLPSLSFSPIRLELASTIGPGAKDKTVMIYRLMSG